MKTIATKPLPGIKSGFTLIEILIATTLFAVVVGALYSVFYGAMRLRERAYLRFEKTVPKNYAFERMKMDLASAMPPDGILASSMISQTSEKMNARSDSLEFYSSTGIIDQNNPWGDIQRILFYLAPPELADSKGYDLVRAITRNLLSPNEELPEEEHLFTDVESLAFSFYDGTSWLESWDSTAEENRLPTAIRVRVTFTEPLNVENAERQPPVELLVPLVAVSANATPTPAEGSTDSQSTGGDNTQGGSNTGGQQPGGNTGGQSPGGGRPGSGGGRS